MTNPAIQERSLNIDILKGLAIIAVVLYHANGVWFPYGFLGVDVFFVIGGYFMMKTFLHAKVFDWRSCFTFLWRRIVRICPIVFLLSAFCLLISYFIMLPDDLENMGESVVATNLFANNVLARITTKNYWDVINEYKPLMHTWYIGVLMQANFCFSILFCLCVKITRNKTKAVSQIILAAMGISLLLFFIPTFPKAAKFYYLPFRAFEVLFGAYIAMCLKNGWQLPKIKNGVIIAAAFLLLAFLLFLFFCPYSFVPNNVKLLLAVATTGLLLLIYTDTRTNMKKNFATSLLALIGMASFSIYLWHQPELAIGRYCLFAKWNIHALLSFGIGLILLSGSSYFFIEKKLSAVFLNKKRQIIMSGMLIVMFTLTTAGGLSLYYHAGIVRNIPELGISIQERKRGMHSSYNSRIYGYDKDFSTNSGKIKILVVGNSFARDWANILLESQYCDRFEISYIYPCDPEYVAKRSHRFKSADWIFCHGDPEDCFFPVEYPQNRLFIIGTKNFGKSNGFIYAKRFKKDYFEQRVVPIAFVLNDNSKAVAKYHDRYIDFISCIIDKNGRVPVFTPDHKFISQDCRHLTVFGARFYAGILNIQRFVIAPDFVKKP